MTEHVWPVVTPIYFLIAALAGVVVLLSVVAMLVHVIVAKARPEDLPQILPGLGQVLESLSLFLPWNRRAKGTTKMPVPPRKVDRR